MMRLLLIVVEIRNIGAVSRSRLSQQQQQVLASSYSYCSYSTTATIDWDKKWSIRELAEQQHQHIVTKEQLEHLASLSMLKLKDSDIDSYCKQLGGVLHAMDTMQQVDTTGVQPMHSVLENDHIIMHDEDTSSKDSDNNDDDVYLKTKTILQHSTSTIANFYKVPKRVKTLDNNNSNSTNNNKTNNRDEDDDEEF
ncbi:glutamyl-tRNA amidotransferase C subunit [Cavenderia fasciculata]|uniref:Glutamyl-tRNA amidotransferase C subunit n=1 Tax=Cavenderia fasciculata TaxID=261658 RepID=F4QBW1_CACFS|nr:glutamyl-tRNA amidotransferase C subunit [Cavenderia fasciculata]EGG14699.1 glutamyl-tRNA amidotransferase C subunit [Cavenderia fasciculata]|eukprot:XP_004351207.1 glutamyl-tRNA amidotransferase C subunit [Cavenderia fasciculata]